MWVITIIVIVNYSSTATGYSMLLSCIVYGMQLATTEVPLLLLLHTLSYATTIAYIIAIALSLELLLMNFTESECWSIYNAILQLKEAFYIEK